MEPITELSISCQGATLVSLDELQDIQGNLKDLDEKNYVKLRNSLIKYGFSFPIFYWADESGTKWILDAHQRKRTLLKMREEGISIPQLPADPIFAKSKVEAKEKLLILNSRYGKITPEGYEEFINEEGATLLEEDITDMLELPEIGFRMDESGEVLQEDKPKTNVTCPNCQTVFTP